MALPSWVTGAVSQAIGSGLGGALGKAFGGSSGKSRESQSWASIAHQNRVWSNIWHYAPKYGIHPLTALGSQPYLPTGGADKDYGSIP